MLLLLVKSVISIHAPREGGDLVNLGLFIVQPVISIHAPREGGDGAAPVQILFNVQFQSTPPARGATLELRIKLI